MIFRIEIDISSPVFGLTDGELRAELSLILEHIAHRIKTDCIRSPMIVDSNGHRVGSCLIIPQPGESN